MIRSEGGFPMSIKYDKIRTIEVKTPEAKKRLIQILLEAQKRPLNPSGSAVGKYDPSVWNFEKHS